MPRVVVVGHPAQHGPLPCSEFANMLATRLGAPHVPFALRSPAERQVPADTAHWVVSEPAGVFTEHAFRQADVVVWLHFHPMDFLRDWFAQARDTVNRLVRGRSSLESWRARRAHWKDIVTAFAYRMMAGEMYQLFAHPALAHVRVVELRTPAEAEFWLLAQRRAARNEL